MKDNASKIKALVFNKDVNFFLCATVKLKQLIVANEHPYIKKLNADVKAGLLEDKALVLDKQDVLAFAEGTLSEEGKFLFSNGDVRVVGSPSTIIK